MVRLGDDPAAAPPGPTMAAAAPGERLDLAVWYQDVFSIFDVIAYQIILPWSATGGDSGTVQYIDNNPAMMEDSDTVFVDQNNPEWLFANAPFAQRFPVYYNETLGSIFGTIYNYLPGQGVDAGPGGDVPNPGGPNYVVQFAYQLSADACGTFNLPFNVLPASPPLSTFFNPYGADCPFCVTFEPLQIVVGQPNDECDSAVAISGGSVASAAFNTFCASADDSSECGMGGDVWYTYAVGTALPTELQFSSTAGDVVVYGPNITCPPASEGLCNPGPIEAQPGETYLIRVIGDNVQGTLAVTRPCEIAADCADLNADGIRDDNCLWWQCAAGDCLATDVVFGDVGGAQGACPPDGTADGHDRFHVLNCFANQTTQGLPAYPCEDTPPWAANVDPGGPTHSYGDPPNPDECQPDGVCDANDVFHVLHAFSGTSSCSCPLNGGPAPSGHEGASTAARERPKR